MDVLSQSRKPFFDVILMDCQMPVMDGYEATLCIREGKAGAQYKNIHIIATTANAQSDDEHLCRSAGMDDYISKPIEEDVLIKKLLDWSR